MVPVVERAAQLRMPTSTRGWASTALVAAKTLISAPAKASVRCMTNPPLLTPVHPTGASDRVKTRHLAAKPQYVQSTGGFACPIQQAFHHPDPRGRCLNSGVAKW